MSTQLNANASEFQPTSSTTTSASKYNVEFFSTPETRTPEIDQSIDFMRKLEKIVNSGVRSHIPFPDDCVGKMGIAAFYGPPLPETVQNGGKQLIIAYILERVAFATDGTPDNHADSKFCSRNKYWCEPYWPGAPLPRLTHSDYGWQFNCNDSVAAYNADRTRFKKALLGPKPFTKWDASDVTVQTPAGHRLLSGLFRQWNRGDEDIWKWVQTMFWYESPHNVPDSIGNFLPLPGYEPVHMPLPPGLKKKKKKTRSHNKKNRRHTPQHLDNSFNPPTRVPSRDEQGVALMVADPAILDYKISSATAKEGNKMTAISNTTAITTTGIGASPLIGAGKSNQKNQTVRDEVAELLSGVSAKLAGSATGKRSIVNMSDDELKSRYWESYSKVYRKKYSSWQGQDLQTARAGGRNLW